MRRLTLLASFLLVAGLSSAAAAQLLADPVTITVRSDSTWRTSAGVVSVTGDWISALEYDDSDSAGWVNAFKSPSGDNIWHTGNRSSGSPNHARFRHVFELPRPVQSAFGVFFFDDEGSAFINGDEVVNHDGFSKVFEFDLDPELFKVGSNLIVFDAFDRRGPFNNIAVRLNITLVPEPSSIALALFATLGLSFYRRRRRRA